MELLFKALAHLHHVVIGLGVLLGAGSFRLGLQLGKVIGAYIGQLLLACQDVHGQLLVVLQVQLVHLVQHGNVLQKDYLVVFQLPDDLVHIGLHLGILGLHGLQLVLRLLQEAEEALLLLFLAEFLQLRHQLAQRLAHLAQVLGTDAGQGVFAKARHVLLGGGAVLEDQGGIHNVDLLGKVLHSLLLRLGEHAVIQHHGLGLRLGLLDLRGGGGGGNVTQGQSDLLCCRGSQFLLKFHFVCHVVSPFLCQSSSLISYSSSPLPVWALKGWPVRPSRAIMVSSTVISAEISRASAP